LAIRVYKTPRFVSYILRKRKWGFLSSEPLVYLTFDDGPDPDITPWVLDYLKSEGLPATFFCVGQNVLKHPELFERIKSEGHQVGNHTMRHENSAHTEWKQYHRSVMDCEKLIGNKLFRPPYGRLSSWRARFLSRKYQIVMWSWLSYDFDLTAKVESILKSADKNISSGSVLVFHDNAKVKERMKEILPQVVAICRQKNLNFAIISA
jgi:peptidoglycan-N-acetylglucosamine deacetylase